MTSLSVPRETVPPTSVPSPVVPSGGGTSFPPSSGDPGNVDVDVAVAFGLALPAGVGAGVGVWPGGVAVAPTLGVPEVGPPLGVVVADGPAVVVAD
ncbi:MAG: hypothetical protein LC640_12200, partial [Frankia sp.]|nr:hypothetical protein [Frankia sp.]